jgi:hypothetical protein
VTKAEQAAALEKKKAFKKAAATQAEDFSPKLQATVTRMIQHHLKLEKQLVLCSTLYVQLGNPMHVGLLLLINNVIYLLLTF